MEDAKIEHSDIVNKFVSLITDLWGKIENKYNGILLCIDEVDRLEESVQLAYFIKSSTEELSRKKMKNLCVMISGVDSYIDVLRRQHNSSPRLFENINLTLMTEKESIELIEKAIEHTSVTIKDNAISLILLNSGRRPSYLQLIGYHAFKINMGTTIGLGDVQRAITYIISEEKIKELKSAFSEIDNDV